MLRYPNLHHTYVGERGSESALQKPKSACYDRPP